MQVVPTPETVAAHTVKLVAVQAAAQGQARAFIQQRECLPARRSPSTSSTWRKCTPAACGCQHATPARVPGRPGTAEHGGRAAMGVQDAAGRWDAPRGPCLGAATRSEVPRGLWLAGRSIHVTMASLTCQRDWAPGPRYPTRCPSRRHREGVGGWD